MNYHRHFRTKDDTDSKVSSYFEFVSVQIRKLFKLLTFISKQSAAVFCYCGMTATELTFESQYVCVISRQSNIRSYSHGNRNVIHSGAPYICFAVFVYMIPKQIFVFVQIIPGWVHSRFHSELNSRPLLVGNFILVSWCELKTNFVPESRASRAWMRIWPNAKIR